MTREELNKKIDEELKQDTKSYILNLATSYGKSALSLHIVNKLKLKKPKILLLVAEKAHKDNWQVEIGKFLKRKIELRVECYQSLHKLQNMKFDIVIADEAHHLNTPLRFNAFTTIHFMYSIFLSATLKPKFKDELVRIYSSVDFTVDLQTAIENKTLPTPRIVVLYSDIPKTERCYQFRVGREDNPYTIRCDYAKYQKEKFSKRHATFIVSCTFKEYCSHYKSIRDYYQKQLDKQYRKSLQDKYLNAVLKEKRFLGYNKTGILKRYADMFRSGKKRFLIFTTSIEQANEIGNALTSQTKRANKVIDAYNSRVTNELITVNMLQEGQNLVDTEVGFIAQVDASDRSIIQKVGRLLRHPNPTILIHYFKGTIEETYTLNAISDNFSSEYVEFKELPLV